MQVHALKTVEEFQRSANFGYEVYRQNPYWVPPDEDHLISIMSGEAPTSSHSRVQAFWVEEGKNILATLTAVVDEMCNRHWNESMGHLLFFEALPGCGEAVQALFQTACDWLRTQGCQAARASFLYAWQLPLTTDAYDAVPTVFHTYNPAYYHSYIKNAGFGTEQGMVQYQIAFTPELARMYQEMVERAARAGVGLRPWNFDLLEEETTVFTNLLNETFSAHWGSPQFTHPQIREFIQGMRDLLVADFTGFAEMDGQVVGFVFALPDLNEALHKMRGKAVDDPAEFLRLVPAIDHGVLLIIGVKPGYRGRGINLALAAKSYLAMIERDYKTGSYTVVLDDNWPSRRTAEKLGGKVTRNFIIYRKELASQKGEQR